MLKLRTKVDRALSTVAGLLASPRACYAGSRRVLSRTTTRRISHWISIRCPPGTQTPSWGFLFTTDCTPFRAGLRFLIRIMTLVLRTTSCTTRMQSGISTACG